jgi:two-component system cell cycle response regulator
MARILIVEDNPANLYLLNYLLNAHGHTTESAADGVEGLARVRSMHPDLVLCDLQMPRLDGYEVLREIRADPSLAGVAVVAVTAYSMPGDQLRVTQAGFDGYLTKPFNPETVIAQIEGYLAAARTPP